MAWQKALTDEQERRLVVDYEDGFTNVALARRYGISESTVYRILADYKQKRKQGNKNKPRAPRREQAKGRTLKPCGTNAAYARHIRNKEQPCPPCCEAHAKQQDEYMERKKS